MNRASQKTLSVPVSDFRFGDRIRVIDREATPEENKKRIFYNHMRGLTGVVRRVYEEEKEIWVDVDRNSLPDDILTRHQETEKRMKSKWLDGLSDEARRRLNDAEKRFELRYSIVVSVDHLILEERGAEQVASAPEAPRRVTLNDLNSAEQEFLDRARTGQSPE